LSSSRSSSAAAVSFDVVAGPMTERGDDAVQAIESDATTLSVLLLAM
jgi:hypothetical protein